MKSLSKLLGLTIVCLMLTTGQAMASSLWSDGAQTSVLFGDQRARAVGDILTVVVNESSTASRSGSASNSKAAANNVDKGTGLLGFIPDSTLSQDDSFKAQGTINNSNKVTARLTVKVIEVKPNGNLVISGVQNIRQNGEEQRITSPAKSVPPTSGLTTAYYPAISPTPSCW